MKINIFRSVNLSPVLAVVIIAGTFFLLATPVFSADDDEDLEGTVWLIPEQIEILAFSKGKSGDAIEANGFIHSTDQEKGWVGTYKNKRLELVNPYYVELVKQDAVFRGSYERIEATVDGSSLTGRYKFQINYPPTKMDEPISGYCLNCWVDLTTFGLVGLGGIALTGGGVWLRRRLKKRRAKPPDEKPAPEEKTDEEKKPEKEEKTDEEEKDEEKKPCAARWAKFLAAVDDYEKHDRIISEILETVRFLEEGRKTVEALEPEIIAAENDYESRLKYLLLLESGEQVVEWGGQALMWFGGLVSGGFSRIMSSRAERLANAARYFSRAGYPLGGATPAMLEAKAALAGNLSNLATTIGIAAAFAGSLAYFAPGARKSLEKMYQEVLAVRMQLKQFEMLLNIQEDKLAARTEELTKRDQNRRFNEILKLKQKMLPDCLDEYQKARDRIGGDKGDYLPKVRGLRADWRKHVRYDDWRFTTDLLDRS